MNQVETVETPFAAVWLRGKAARHQVLQRAQDCGLSRTASGGYLCLCGAAFAQSCKEACADCFLQHGRDTLDRAVRETVPPLSEPGLGGRWLAEGESCEACGSTAGGWLCAGGAGHIASCQEASLFQGSWDLVPLASDGFLAVDGQKHCVHLDGTFSIKRRDACLQRIQQHLRCHGSAASHYWLRLAKYTTNLRMQRPPTLVGKMMAKTGPSPPDFQSRLRAFQRTERRMSAGDLLQHMLHTSNERLPVAVEEDKCLRSGSVLLHSMQSDGKVILQIRKRESKFLAAKVVRNQACARHPRCVCYTISDYEQEWMPMKAAEECLVVCLMPRFGWRHDFTLPLSKVCWRIADTVGNVNEKLAALRQQRPAGRQVSLRCGKMLEMCRESAAWRCEDWQALRCLGIGLDAANMCFCLCLVSGSWAWKELM